MAKNQNMREVGASTQFKKGKSGNPKGRPPKTITEYLRIFGESREIKTSVVVVDNKGEERTIVVNLKSSGDPRKVRPVFNEILAGVLWAQAISGDPSAQRTILERLDGETGSKAGEEPDMPPPPVTFTRADFSEPEPKE